MTREDALQRSEQYIKALMQLDTSDIIKTGHEYDWDYCIAVLPFMSVMLEHITEWNNDLDNLCCTYFEIAEPIFDDVVKYNEDLKAKGIIKGSITV